MNVPNEIELYCDTTAESPNSGTVARHRLDKHVSSAANDSSTVEEPLEAVSCTRFVVRLCKENQLDRQVNRQSVGGRNWR
jgi:hypothetical protein